MRIKNKNKIRIKMRIIDKIKKKLLERIIGKFKSIIYLSLMVNNYKCSLFMSLNVYRSFTTSCNTEDKSLKRDMASLIDQRMLFQSPYLTGYSKRVP